MNAFSGNNLVGPLLGNYLGEAPRVLGLIKKEPEHFIVQEQCRTHLCTVSPDPDLTQEQLDAMTGDLVSATLVLRKLTTFDGAIRLARKLGIKVRQISYGGMKDRWAITAQRIVISGVSLERVRAISNPCQLNGVTWFIKDVARAEKPLRQGHLVANHFQLRVGFPGWTKQQIEAYIQPRVDLLAQLKWVFPNFYGRQRLGRRQNLTNIGYTLMTEGAEQAIKAYLTETSELESAAATAVRKKLAQTWAEGEEAATRLGVNIAELEEYFFTMMGHLENHASLNLANEYMLVKRIFEVRNFNEALRDTKEKITGLWGGAYQSFWFNRALERYMRGEVQLPDGRIPLYIKDRYVEDWYRRNGMADAIIDNMDPFVQETFLSAGKGRMQQKCSHAANQRAPWNRQYMHMESAGPRRKALTRVGNFRHQIEDDHWNVQFSLESGGYATSVMQMFVELDTGDNAVTECTNS